MEVDIHIDDAQGIQGVDDKALKNQGVAAALEEGAVDSNAVTSGGTLSAEATSSFSSSFEPTWYVP